MKIGILGAPGVGKSSLARGLARELGDTHVVDNYVQRLQKSTGLALGLWADYPQNMMIAGVREAARLKATNAKYQITVGTLMDTMVYVMAHGDIALHSNPAEAQQIYHDTRAVVNGITLWYNMTWDYDVCFFLSHQGEPKSDGILERFPYELSKAYPMVLDTFFTTVYGLDGETKERVKVAREVVDILERDQEARTRAEDNTSASEERSVRPGVSDGESVGNPPRPMSDVSIEN